MDELTRTFSDPGSAAWAVHADQLIAGGDPRGQLIAIELRLDQAPSAAERETLEAAAAPLREGYAAALRKRLPDDPMMAFMRLEWRFGYLCRVESLIPSERTGPLLAAILATDEAQHLPKLLLRFLTEDSAQLLEVMTAAPRCWRSLTLERNSYDATIGTPLELAACERFSQMLPELRELHLVARTMFERLEHPQLEALSISGHDAIVDLGGGALPALKSMDLALMSGTAQEDRDPLAPDRDRIAELMSGRGMPALCSLDLSRNNPGRSHNSSFLGGDRPRELFGALARSPLLERLEALALPTPRDPQLLELCAQLVRVPRIRVPWFYRFFARPSREELLAALPQLEIDIDYPHRPTSVIADEEVIAFTATHPSDEQDHASLALSELAGMLEPFYASLSASARASLDGLVSEFETLVTYTEGPREATLATTPLRAAIDELRGQIPIDIGLLGEISNFLARHDGCCEQVVIQKVWSS